MKNKVEHLSKKYSSLELAKEEQKIQLENQRQTSEALFSKLNSLEHQLSLEIEKTHKQNQVLLNEAKSDEKNWLKRAEESEEHRKRLDNL